MLEEICRHTTGSSMLEEICRHTTGSFMLEEICRHTTASSMLEEICRHTTASSMLEEICRHTTGSSMFNQFKEKNIKIRCKINFLYTFEVFKILEFGPLLDPFRNKIPQFFLWPINNRLRYDHFAKNCTKIGWKIKKFEISPFYFKNGNSCITTLCIFWKGCS
jgi:hypothetical protein